MPEITPEQFIRIANNFYTKNGLVGDINRIKIDSHLINDVFKQPPLKKYKVAFCSIVLNPPYWQYAKRMIETAKEFLLPGHDVDFLVWSDIPTTPEDVNKVLNTISAEGLTPEQIKENYTILHELSEFVNSHANVFPTEPVEWPMPTLMRYHLFLQQEELLKEYDYIFYCDVDMLFVNVVGDEILGDALTAAPHPGYYVRKELWPPFEPNPNSASYIKRPGLLINDAGKPRFQPMYWAGGFQGGKTKPWIKAMKAMRKLIDADLSKSYIPIWNDESAWNKYLSENPPSVMLNPSYVYPDSLIKEYYEPKVWGQSFLPKIITITKQFTTSKEGGEAVAKMIS